MTRCLLGVRASIRQRQWPALFAVTSLLCTGCENNRPAVPPDGAGTTGGLVVRAAVEEDNAEPENAVATGREYAEEIELRGASVHGYETTELKAKLGGYVKTIGKVGDDEIDIGLAVEQSAVLALLDVPEMEDDIHEQMSHVEQAKSAVLQAQAAVAEAEAQVLQRKAELEQVRAKRAEKTAMLKLNQTKYKRLSGLADDGAIGAENLDEAEFAVTAAEASLQSIDADVKAAQTNIQAAEASVRKYQADQVSAQANVAVAEAGLRKLKTLSEYMVIKAPYSGVITKRMVDHGTFVPSAEDNSAAMPMFEITRTDRVRVIVAVPSSRMERIHVGQDVTLHTIGGLPGRTFAGTIARIAGALDLREARTLPVEIDFTNPVQDVESGDEIVLKPGMFGTLTVNRREWSGDNLLPVVPTSAIGVDADGRRYVVVIGDGKRERRNVEIAFDDGIEVGISEGLDVGSEVALSGLDEYRQAR